MMMAANFAAVAATVGMGTGIEAFQLSGLVPREGLAFRCGASHCCATTKRVRVEIEKTVRLSPVFTVLRYGYDNIRFLDST